MKIGVLMIVLWLVNFRLPFVGSFFAEVYIIQYLRVMLIVLVVIYILVGYVSIKSLNMDRKGMIYIPFLVLYVLVV